MAGHTKSPSHDRYMFGFGNICRAYRCLISRKKNPSPNKHKFDSKSANKLTSFDETCKASNDKNETKTVTNDLIQELRSHNGNGVHPHDENIPNSLRHDLKNHNYNNKHFKSTPNSSSSRSSSPSPLHNIPTLSRSMSQSSRSSTPTKNRLMRSLTRQKTETTEPHVLESLLKSDLMSQKPENGVLSKSFSRNGTMARNGSLSRSSSRKGAAPIMYSKSNGLIKLPPMEKTLECCLEELCFGCVKRIIVTRDVFASNGLIEEEEETLTIKIKPGWTKGTKITFEGTTNEEQGTHSSDIIFVIAEKKHSLYRREGDDLELAMRIPLVDALTGCTLSVPLLGGENMNLTVDEIIEFGHEKIIPEQGMPMAKDRKSRGNLKLKFLVKFPNELSEEQRREVVSILQDCC